MENILYFLSGLSCAGDYKCSKILSKSIYIYLFVSRIVLFAGLVSYFVVPYDQIDTVVRVYAYAIGAESIPVMGCVMYGQRFLIENFEKIAVTDDTKSELMKTQSRVLIGVCVFRLLYNIIATILSAL